MEKFLIFEGKKMKKIFCLTALGLMLMAPISASAHCDTMDGPTVADGKKAMQNNNVNYALKWVQPKDEHEIKELFEKSMKVRSFSADAKEIAERLFLETLVRVHRLAEDAPFTGVKPAGTPIDAKVLAADKSIEVGNLSPSKALIEKEKLPELQKKFDHVMALKNFDVNNVKAGREYIEAYVAFFKFAEGEEVHHAPTTHETTEKPQAKHAH